MAPISPTPWKQGSFADRGSTPPELRSARPADTPTSTGFRSTSSTTSSNATSAHPPLPTAQTTAAGWSADNYGARVIKVCASGGVMSQVDHPKHQQFSDEELSTIVEEAARAERVVAAHCHGKPGIMAALRAGVKTIEHGSHLDVEAAKAMADSGAILVPTRFVVQHLVDRGLEIGMPDYAFKKINDIAERHFQAMQTAISYGVTIAAGTDIFMPGTAGRNGEELGHLVEAGLTPVQAIEAATATGPLTLGPQAPEAGRLIEGYDADVICVTGDPTEDISILADPTNVSHVFQRGTLVKG